MKKLLLNSTLIACAVGLPAAICAEVLDFSKIVHWTGEGDNEAALIVQFDEPMRQIREPWCGVIAGPAARPAHLTR